MIAYQRVPGFAPVAEAVYRLIARRRQTLSRVERLLRGPNEEPPGHVGVRWVFLRLLGLVYLSAFLSLWTQADGLIGSNGILPVSQWLADVHDYYRGDAYRQMPTLCWLDSGDGFLHVILGAGTALSLILVAGVAPAPVLFLLWACWLSLVSVGQDFLSFQWDSLLLEAGFLAIFLAPTTAWTRPSREAEPSPTVLFLLHWLLFRLIFFSGVVKLSSQDPTWADWTAMEYHYWTQPLPTWTAWYMNRLPAWFHRASVGGMLGVELFAPFLIFAPRRLRLMGGGAIAGLMVTILATGNYGYFNWLSLGLCLLLLDDSALPRRLRERLAPAAGAEAGRWSRPLLAGVFVMVGAATLATAAGQLGMSPDPNGRVAAAAAAVEPFRIANRYGLFAIMTTTRPEIVVEGSVDGETWRAYEFKYKPGDPKRRPVFVAPHQPRLDWQMWFAALSPWHQNRWFVQFCQKLMEGSPAVCGLLEHDPFPDQPPRYVRATEYDYRFATAADGRWWTVRRKGPYCPVLSLPEK